jgi:hypothetical protein
LLHHIRPFVHELERRRLRVYAQRRVSAGGIRVVRSIAPRSGLRAHDTGDRS